MHQGKNARHHPNKAMRAFGNRRGAVAALPTKRMRDDITDPAIVRPA
jgi:hypothetical protein